MLKILFDDHVAEYSDESLNIESECQLGPTFPNKVPSLAIILAPSKPPHSQEFTLAMMGEDNKPATNTNSFISVESLYLLFPWNMNS